MRDLAIPAAHQPWCEDRDKVRSQDHASDGSMRCTSSVVRVGQTPVYLVEARAGGGRVDVAVGELEYPIAQAVALAAAITTVVNTLGGVE